jgi:4-amino-4-deoxy-L-arabinose transferase
LFAGASVGCAVLCKWLPALVVVPVWALLCYRQLPLKTLAAHLALMLVAVVVVAAPWQWYILTHFPLEAHYEYAFNARHFTEVLSNQGGSFFYHFDSLRISYGELVYLPVLWFTYKALKGREAPGLAVLCWFWLPYLFFSFCATKMAAYTIFAAPAVFIITAQAYTWFRDRLQFKPTYLRLAIAYSFILLPVRYTLERAKLLQPVERNPDWNQAIEQFAANKLNTSQTIVFNCPHYIEAMFLTNCTCYEHMPPEGEPLARLKKAGYHIIIQQGCQFKEVDTPNSGYSY